MTAANSAKKGHVASLDLLRGLASLAVCFFHFSQGNARFLQPGALKSVGALGWVGVEAFFVISGFIIPYTLHRSRYSLRDIGIFLVKRVIRLDPPYLISIIIILALNYCSTLAPGFAGRAFEVSAPQVLLHLGYANAFVGYPWLNPVFWTLAIEAQYYIVIGLLYPLLSSPRLVVWLLTMALMVLSAVICPQPQFVFHWMPLFLLGIITFQYRRGAASVVFYGIVLALLTVAGFLMYGGFVTLIGATTAAVIAFYKGPVPRVAMFFGTISYSLYLLHVPIGGRIINLGTRFAATLPAKVAVLVGAFVAAVAAAWLLHWLVERPAQQWSAAISYRKRVVPPTGFASQSG